MNPEEPIDWEDARERLEAVRLAVAHGFSPSPEEEKRLLKARARELAHEAAAETDARDLLEIVEFELAGERYGLPLTHVREVCALKDLTPVPCTPAFVLGVINSRGEIHTVIDLKKFFDLPAVGITEMHKVLLLGGQGMRLGILADVICGVRTLLLKALQPALPTLTNIRADYLRGVTGDRLVVLDAEKILSDPRLLVDARDDV